MLCTDSDNFINVPYLLTKLNRNYHIRYAGQLVWVYRNAKLHDTFCT